MSFMLMQTDSGNMIDSFDNQYAGIAAVDRILKTEPEAASHMTLIEFDETGMAIKIWWPQEEEFGEET